MSFAERMIEPTARRDSTRGATAGALPASVSPPNAYRPLLRLALPIIGVNVGMMLMGVVDTLMVGRLSPQALAAVALGNLYGMAVLMFGLGILLSLDPVLSQAHGADEHETVALGVQRGVVLAIVLSVPLAGVMWFAEPFLRPRASRPMSSRSRGRTAAC